MNDRTVDGGRMERARTLQVELLSPGRYRVTGGRKPHIVQVQDGGPWQCDCPDSAFRPSTRCKHMLAVGMRTTAPQDDVLDRIEAEAAEEPAPRFRLLRLADVERLPDPTYLVDGVLPEGASVMLYGAPGCGKTFLALDLALTIATGRSTWFGRTAKAGRVVYVATEGLSGLKRRTGAWAFAHPDAPDGPIQFIGEPVQLLQLEDVAQFCTAIQLYRPDSPALIILDTLSRCTPGGDENSVQDTSLAVRSVDYIRRWFGATVLILHHTQKAGDLERGSGNWRAAVDVMLHVRHEDSVRELRTTKVRDGAPLEGLQFVLRPTLESCIIASPDASDADRLTANQREALAVLGRLSASGSRVTATAWLKTSLLQERTFWNAKAKLQELRLVQDTAKGLVVTPLGRSELQLQSNCNGPANAPE
jgi:hypothetical protein